MKKLIYLIYTLTGIVHATHYYNCKERAFCNRYRTNLIWGNSSTDDVKLNSTDDVKLNSQYNVDDFVINNKDSSISIDLSLNLTAHSDKIDNPPVPTE